MHAGKECDWKIGRKEKKVEEEEREEAGRRRE